MHTGRNISVDSMYLCNTDSVIGMVLKKCTKSLYDILQQIRFNVNRKNRTNWRKFRLHMVGKHREYCKAIGQNNILKNSEIKLKRICNKCNCKKIWRALKERINYTIISLNTIWNKRAISKKRKSKNLINSTCVIERVLCI